MFRAIFETIAPENVNSKTYRGVDPALTRGFQCTGAIRLTVEWESPDTRGMRLPNEMAAWVRADGTMLKMSFLLASHIHANDVVVVTPAPASTPLS